MINNWVKNLHSKCGLNNGNQMVIRLVLWSIIKMLPVMDHLLYDWEYYHANQIRIRFLIRNFIVNVIWVQRLPCLEDWMLVFYPLTIWVTCFQIQKVENIPFEHFIASPYTPTVTEKKVQVNPCCPPRFLSTQHTTIAKMSRKTRYITWWGRKKLWKMWLWYVLCST